MASPAQRGGDGKLDAVLIAFVRAPDAATAERLMEEIFAQHAEPAIRTVIRRRLYECFGSQASDALRKDAEDVYGEAVVSLIRRLNACRESPDENVVESLRGYAATIAAHTCDHYLRRKYAGRSRLENKVRYLLDHQDGFALWRHAEGPLCGFADWRGRARVSQARLQALMLDGRAVRETLLGGVAPDLSDLVTLIEAVFHWSGGPVSLDELVGIMVTACDVKEAPESDHRSEEEDRAGSLERMPDPSTPIDRVLEQRDYLEKLWQEICLLPPLQRRALLLSSRDSQGHSILELLPVLGIATFRQIAGVLEMDAAKFAELFQRLPLEDDAIGRDLGKKRQQVINLRKAARERLARRMQAP